MGIKVMLVDDHVIVRQGIRSLLEEQEDMVIVGEASDGLEAVRKASEILPDVVLMDISMPNMNGVEAMRNIVSNGSKARVIMLSAYVNRKFVSESIKAGASGYISKDCVFGELSDAIRVVNSGQNYISPSIASVLIGDYVGHIYPDQEVRSALSGRERSVLQMLAEGKNTKEIAKVLGVSGKTVDADRRSIMDKLDKHSLAELTKYAISEGLTTLEF